MTSDASRLTGPSVILGYVVLAPVVLASAVAYVVYLSTPLGREPGGEYTHVSRTFAAPGLAFVGAWLKLISYVGAGAFLALALAQHLLELARQLGLPFAPRPELLGLACLLFFLIVHLLGVRWFGRLQVGMCAVLGVSIVVLVLPGLFAIDRANYRPFFTGGARGFAASLPLLFFAYAGFESLAQAAGEVRDSSRRLPQVFWRGIAATSVIFVLMSVVAFGALPAARLESSETPMADAAGVYLPFGAHLLVTVGAVMAVATSLNATMLVPARLALMLARDGLLPRLAGTIHARRGTPVPGLLVSFAVTALLLLSGRGDLALGIAVLALLLLYGLHSLALLLLPRCNPELYRQVTVRLPRWVQVSAGALSLASICALVAVQVASDWERVAAAGAPGERWRTAPLTSVGLVLLGSVVGWLVYTARGRWSAPGDGARGA